MAQDPIRRRRDEDYDDEPKAKREISPIALALGSVVLAVLVVYLLFNPSGKMDKTDVQKQLDANNTEVTKQLTDTTVKFNKLQTDMATANAVQIKDAISKLPDAQVAVDAKNIATAAKSTADSVKALADKAQSDATQAQKSADVVNSNINVVKTDLDKKLADNTASLAKLQKQVDDLTTKVNAQPTPTVATNTNTNTSGIGTGSATNGQVTASIVSYSSSLYSGMYFNNTNSSSNSILSIAPVKSIQYDANTENATNHPNETLIKFGDSNVPWWVNKTVTSQFQLQINNNTGKTISNIQLGLAFIFIKADGTQINVPYAPDGSFALSSMGNPQWTNTGSDASYTSWTTGAANSILANLWNFGQQSGTSTYYSTLTYTLPTYATPTGAPSLPSSTIYAVPMLKIVSYVTN